MQSEETEYGRKKFILFLVLFPFKLMEFRQRVGDNFSVAARKGRIIFMGRAIFGRDDHIGL